MWGKKSQKTNDVSLQNNQASDGDVDTSAFSVHTMQDDVRAQSATQKEPQQTASMPPQDTAQTPTPSPFATQEADASAPSAPNPFADTTTTAVDSVPQQDGIGGEESATPTYDVGAQAYTPTDQVDMATHAAEEAQSQQPFASLEQNGAAADAHQYGDNATASVTDAYSDHGNGTRAHSLLTFMMIFIGVLLVAGIAFGVYWFNKRATVDEVMPEVTTQDDDQADSVLPSYEEEDTTEFTTPTLSYDFPNTLILPDRATAITTFKEFLRTTDETMRQENMSGPITFLVKDAQQNPLPFRTFTEMIQLQLSEEARAALGDAFELYAYQENGQTFYGFATDVRNQTQAQEAISAQEWQLPSVLSPLFLAGAPTMSDPIFAPSTYNGHAIRYVNFTPGLYSVDYSFTQGRFLVATTKNMMRRMLDRLFPADVQVETAVTTEQTAPIESGL